MDEIAVSVVLPSLNVVPYIGECLASVRGQTLQEMEILCVDAGSTDGTLEFLRQKAAEDCRIRLIESGRKSVGHQMNLGVREARGEYIGIVETDDYVMLEMFEKLYHAAKERDAEIARMDFEAFWGEGAGRQFLPKPVARDGQYGRILVPKDEQEVFANDMSIWAGIYKRSFLLEHDIWQNETEGAAYQDQGFYFQAFACARRLLYVQGAEHGYRYRLDNASSSIHSRGKAHAVCEEFAFIRRQLEERGLFEAFRDTFYVIQFNRYLWNYLRLDAGAQKKFVHRFAEDMQEAAGGAAFPPHQRELLGDLLASPEQFHASRQAEHQRLLAMLHSLRPVILFGCGSDGIRMLDYLRGQGELGHISCLADNRAALHGIDLFGKKVLSPEAAQKQYSGAFYLVASLNYGDAICKQLIDAGESEQSIWMGHVC